MYMRPLATSRRLTVRLLPPRLAGGISRDQWCDQRPFLVGQVTWVAQLAPVVATTVLTRPHQRLPPDRNAAKGITTDSQHSRCFRMDTKIPWFNREAWPTGPQAARIDADGRPQGPPCRVAWTPPTLTIVRSALARFRSGSQCQQWR